VRVCVLARINTNNCEHIHLCRYRYMELYAFMCEMTHSNLHYNSFTGKSAHTLVHWMESLSCLGKGFFVLLIGKYRLPSFSPPSALYMCQCTLFIRYSVYLPLIYQGLVRPVHTNNKIYEQWGKQTYTGPSHG